MPIRVSERKRRERFSSRVAMRSNSEISSSVMKTAMSCCFPRRNHRRLKKTCGKELTLHARSTQFVAEISCCDAARSSPEARLFLRSFNNAVRAREIRDPTDFVRRFVLEADPLNVERIRSSIETWRSMESAPKRSKWKYGRCG